MGTIMKDYQNFDQIFSRKVELARHEKSLPKYISNLQSKISSLKSSYDSAISTVRSNMKASETSKKDELYGFKQDVYFSKKNQKMRRDCLPRCLEPRELVHNNQGAPKAGGGESGGLLLGLCQLPLGVFPTNLAPRKREKQDYGIQREPEG